MHNGSNAQIPGSDQLAAWYGSGPLSDEGIADRYGLDERFDVASVATFFATRKGLVSLQVTYRISQMARLTGKS